MLLLVSSPFLTWVCLPLGALTVPVPGLFLRGGLVLGLGLLALGFWLLRPRAPGLQLACALAAMGLTGLDLHGIVTRTGYELARLQLKLSGLNETLGTLHLPRLELFEHGQSGWTYVGYGLYVGLAGAGLLLLGAVVEALLQGRQGRSLGSVLVGRPACKACQQRLVAGMSFCPGCGLKLLPVRRCSECKATVAETYRFCPECGASEAA